MFSAVSVLLFCVFFAVGVIAVLFMFSAVGVIAV